MFVDGIGSVDIFCVFQFVIEVGQGCVDFICFFFFYKEIVVYGMESCLQFVFDFSVFVNRVDVIGLQQYIDFVFSIVGML